MSISLSLQQAVYQKLEADTDIMTIAKSVCLVAENPKYPYISLGPTFETVSDLLTLEKSNWRVQIDVWGDKLEDNDDIHTLTSLIEKSFHHKHDEIALNVGRLYLVEMVNKQIVPDFTGWHGIIEFNFKIQKGH